jgi:hypothetical protein
MGRKQKLREEKRKIKNNPPLSITAIATASKTVAPAPAAIIVPPNDHQFPESSTNEESESNSDDKIFNKVVARLLKEKFIDLALANNNYDAFPKSNFHKVGAGFLKVKLFDLALDAFKRGAVETGCVPCMYQYV